MNLEPRQRDDYSTRQIETAFRVLVDLGQVLSPFKDCLVVVGGWIPDLLIPQPEEPHIGSIDVDLALDAGKLEEGGYAKLLETLLNTRRYRQADEPFRLFAEVDLEDGGAPVRVDVDFLKSPEPERTSPGSQKGSDRSTPAAVTPRLGGHPELVLITGRMIRGQANTVRLHVASIADFLIMKSYALANRDKPKDVYDLCFCLDHYPGGLEKLAANWKRRIGERDVIKSIEILKEKFATVDSYGPMQVAEFHHAISREERDQRARRAFELVTAFLERAM